MKPIFSRRQMLAAAAIAPVASALAADAKPAYQIGCYTRPWDQHEYKVALDGIAEAGFKYAGLMTHKAKTWVMVTPALTPDEAAAYGQEAKQRGLTVISAYGDFSAKETVEKAIEQLKKLIDNCAAATCPNLLLGGTSDAKVYETYYKAIAECCGYAAQKKVGLSVKPHGGTNATGAQCRVAIEKVKHKNFGLWYDPGNIFYYSEGKLDPVDDAATVDGLVVGMSVKDFLPPKEVMVAPGEGRVRFAEVMARLRKGGFTAGPLVVECLKREKDGKVITAEAKKAREFLEKLVEGM